MTNDSIPENPQSCQPLISNYNGEKWKKAKYKSALQLWTPPHLVYPVSDTERNALHALKAVYDPLPIYPDMERAAAEKNERVHVDIPIPDGHIAFLENTAETCISPQTKHSQEGMQGARHWVQRVDTPDNVFRRLTDGYGISLMFGERHYQYIRNSNNWRGIYGLQLDIDVFGDDKHPDAPEPCYSQSELFDRYPLIPEICSFLLPSASSLYDGRPFKARGIILYPEPVTDQRIHRAFGDILISELDCIPANVTKNPVAVGFGNTHNAPQVYRNDAPDRMWIADALENAKGDVLTISKQRNREQKHKAELKAHYAANGNHGTGKGENISTFNETCDPVSEMLRDGLLTRGKGNEYRWHESENDRSCDILDGSIHIFSEKMFDASPHQIVNEAVGAHRFYLYQLSGLDMTLDADKPRIREFLFERGYGNDPKDFARQQASRTKAKLKQDPDAETEPTETLAENRANREASADAFMGETEPDTETLHISFFNDSTGTGKTQTIIGKAKQHGKRAISNPPTILLAEQHINTAWGLGYTNPYHLLSREHNWEESGIADIPIAERTADLFSQNNCIMFDEVKRYTDKRLAPRTYCYHKCPFAGKRDSKTGKMHLECPHLLQYEGLGDRDFITSCTPNLLFDVNFRGYLKSLVTATSEPTDEELAIDAILGTESKETEPFDFAIVDDYGVSGLYSDVMFTESEFKRLKKAWSGTPTAAFAKGMLKAFKKKKPYKIVKALRKAFDSTAEHHADISESLNKHARQGVIRTAFINNRLIVGGTLCATEEIQYTDGGKHFIAVDDDAYKKLKENKIPVINPKKLEKHLDTENDGGCVIIPHAPTHALMAGVPLDALTPVWTKGATPIELLKIFFESIGNAENAPINRTFRTGDPPDAVLTFSIPPQAPVGILKDVAMLSATTDPEDVKPAFDGQSVKFSEHIGGLVELASGVQIYQFGDARLTSGSVFEYPKDTDGKRKLQEAPTGLTPTATQRLDKLNDWAKNTDGVTAFISYKEFTDEPFGEAVNEFDIVSHFDKVSGLNFDGLKFLVVFGYPKVSHAVVMNHARLQFSSDTDPLPKADPNLFDDNDKPISEYMQLTEDMTTTENGYTITERRYQDPRLEKIRHQLSTEKLDQALGRARFSTWTDTTTLAFTDAPVARITARATLFSDHAFNLAETPDGLSDAMERIQQAEQTGDVKAVMETKGVGKTHAYESTKEKRKESKAARDAEIIRLHREGMNPTEVERQLKQNGLKASRRTIYRILDNGQKSSRLLYNSNREVEKCPLRENPVNTSLETENESPAVNGNGNGANPPSERPRPAWQDDDYYYEHAIRERQIAAKAALKESEKAVESNIIDPLFDNFVVSNNEVEPPNLHNGDHTTEQKQEVNRLFHAGKSKAEIHQQTGVNPITIDTWLAENVF